MMLPLLATLAALAHAPAADTARAAWHERITFELRGGAAVGEVTAAGSGPQWRPGAAWHAGVAFAPTRLAAIYVAYGQDSFGCDDGLCQNSPVEFTSRGVQAGLHITAGLAWVRGGVIRNTLHSRWETTDGAQRDVGSASTGFEIGAGLALPLAGVVIAPGMRYSAHTGAVTGASRDDGVGFITADLALRFRPFRRR
jgi:hypothetical protein